MVKLKDVLVSVLVVCSVWGTPVGEGEREGVLPPTVQAATMEDQVLVLLNMFDEQSRRKLGWGESAPCQKGSYQGWEGVSCNQQSTGIVMIKIPALNGTRVNGTLPAMGNLTSLVNLMLGGNGLVGTLPESLPPVLRTLDVSFNYFSGTIPKSIANLTNLQHVDLSANSLAGDLPELSQMHSLRSVYLGNNALIGTIPTNLNNLHFLTVVSLFGNSLVGTLPAGLGSLPALSIVYVFGNQLTGTIPAEFGRSPSLTRLYLDTNNFGGKLPSFPNVVNGKLSKLTLADNNWQCPLPDINGTVWQDKADTSCDSSTMPMWLVGCIIGAGVVVLVAGIVFVRKYLKKRKHAAHLYLEVEQHNPPAHFAVQPQSSSARSLDPTVSLFAGVSSTVFHDEQQPQPQQPSRSPGNLSYSDNTSLGLDPYVRTRQTNRSSCTLSESSDRDRQ
eukprot:TRINITY_DN16789_c5_g1_i1.p1 TRINITY_DN16789_c5_g1~~TRINITY_DN16789_c5_g1_i1.p1  ORF type:complete len:444 (+),score=38.07 TRINITY_DN16789_c5_g1_i1:51-1382(+)